MRIVVNDGMDVAGGAGICNGPANFLANAYTSGILLFKLIESTY